VGPYSGLRTFFSWISWLEVPDLDQTFSYVSLDTLNIINCYSTFAATESIRGRCPPRLFSFLTTFLAHFYAQHDHNHCIIEFYTPVTSFYFLWLQHCRYHHSDIQGGPKKICGVIAPECPPPRGYGPVYTHG